MDWFIGDRVKREIYMDDGTWMKSGDNCLPGPLKHGTIINKIWNYICYRYEYLVKWDNEYNESESWVLAHGINKE